MLQAILFWRDRPWPVEHFEVYGQHDWQDFLAYLREWLRASAEWNPQSFRQVKAYTVHAREQLHMGL